MNEKKIRKFSQPEFLDLCRVSGLEPIQIDLGKPLDEQGPFTLIFHKLTDVIARANLGDVEAENTIRHFQRYLERHPEVIMVDPLENIQHLLDRTRTYNLISSSQLGREDVLFTPAFVELTTSDVDANLAKLKAAGVSFPIICKPTVAHGSRLAHQMALMFNEKGLSDVNPPCVAQTFINHGAVLYKLYVVGDKWYQVDRPSLKNFYAGDHETIFFDSHAVSKADSDCCLNKLDAVDQGIPLHQPTTAKMQEIVSTVRETLQMGLFGVDVVIDIESCRYAIVDINAFPGYDGVGEFFDDLINYIIGEIKARTPDGANNPANQVSSSSLDELVSVANLSLNSGAEGFQADDSGIETGDSSDEKKKNQRLILKTATKRSHARSISPSVTANVDK